MDDTNPKRVGESLKQSQILLMGVLFALGLQQILEGVSAYFPLTAGYQHIIDGVFLVIIFLFMWRRSAPKWETRPTTVNREMNPSES
jgi:hypothetical protein